MTETPTTSPVFTIQAKEFAKLLEGLLPLASGDEYLTPIHGVQLMRRGERLALAVTDRFRAAMTSAAVEWDEDAPADWQILLPVPLCKRVVATWKSARAESWWTITLSMSVPTDKGDAECLLRDELGVTAGGTALALDTLPNVESHLSAVDACDDVPSDMVSGFNFDYLVSFAKLRRHRGEQISIAWPKTPSRPIRLDIGTHTVGLLMPVRVNSVRTVEEILGGAA